MAHTPPTTYVLKGLSDVQVPPSISWLPHTIGWKILFIAFTAFSLFAIYNALKKYKKNRYRRLAIKDISLINSDNPYKATCELFHLMKRVAVHLEPSNASKSGKELLQFFLETKTIDCVHFHKKLSEQALQQMWLPETKFTLIPEQVEVLLHQFRYWLLHHSLENYHKKDQKVNAHD